MADKSISELVAATAVGSTDLFVLEQTGTAKKLTGQILENWLVSFADGHGGIQTVAKTGTSGLVDTYTITYADTTTSTFTVTNGKAISSVTQYWAVSTSGSSVPSSWSTTRQTMTPTNKYLWSYMTFTYNDGTTSDTTKSVVGVYGDTGQAWYVWIKYASIEPTSDADMGDIPDNWIGIYSGTSSSAPTHYTDYEWFRYKGEKGNTGDAATIENQSVTYMESSSGTVVPSGSWTTTIPSVTPGNFLWTKTDLTFNDNTVVTAYSVSRYGIDGTGSVSTVNNQSPDPAGNVTITASNIQTSDNQSVQEHIEELESYYKILRVDINGSGDYTSISAAVSAASDGDIILVYPGTYFESVHAYEKKVHIKGIDKKTCILEYYGKNYSTPPLEMAKGSVEDLTIIARNSGTAGSANAYCVHIDNDNEANQSLYFRNVYFYNEIHQAVGIGLRHNFDLTFEDCEFEAIGQAALYCHDWETADTSADKSGQKLNLLNCTLRNNDSSHATIMMQSQELATNCATCKFVGCDVYNANASGAKITMSMWQGRTLTNASFMGSSDWVLDGSSGLNTGYQLNNVPFPIDNDELKPMGIMAFTNFNSSSPLDLNIPTSYGGLCVCMLQGTGFVVLSVFHRTTNEVVVKDITNGGTAFSSSYVSITAPDGSTVRFSTSLATYSAVAVVAPRQLA